MKCHWIGLWILYSFINVKPYKWEFWCQTIVKKIIRTNYKFQIECRTIKQISCYMCKLVLSKRFGSFAVTINTKHTNSHKPTKHLSNRMGKAIEKLRCRLIKDICLKLEWSYLNSIICMVHLTQVAFCAFCAASKKSSCLLLATSKKQPCWSNGPNTIYR